MTTLLQDRARAAVTPEQVAAFARDGAVCLRQLLSAAEVAVLRRGISPAGSLADLPDVDATRAQQPPSGWALEPGDVVCFHMLALHAAAGVDDDRRRRVFSLRLLGDDMRHAPRAWKTSPDFPGLAESLPAGAALDHPLFPLLVGEGA